MAKTKVSEWDSNASGNTDINGININEGCPPSTINNAIRETMAQVKDLVDGSSGDSLTNSGTLTSSGILAVTGAITFDGASGSSGETLLSNGTGATPSWGSVLPSGMIVLWSGSTGTIPVGWVICDGTNSTPDLRNRFVVGAGSTYAVDATGGSKDAVVVSHEHTLSGSTDTEPDHVHTYVIGGDGFAGGSVPQRTVNNLATGTTNAAGSHSHTLSGTASPTGVSGTNANLPPYYALAYIMKS